MVSTLIILHARDIDHLLTEYGLVFETNTNVAVTIGKPLVTTFANTETVTVRALAKKPAVGNNEEFLRTKYYQGFSKGKYAHVYFEGALDPEK